jgi:hypothetical protein
VILMIDLLLLEHNISARVLVFRHLEGGIMMLACSGSFLSYNSGGTVSDSFGVDPLSWLFDCFL